MEPKCEYYLTYEYIYCKSEKGDCGKELETLLQFCDRCERAEKCREKKQIQQRRLQPA